MFHKARFWLCGMFFILMMGMLGGCIPADTPPQLEFTPGAPVVITSETYQTFSFIVDIPAGWRVISSPAENPPAVTFVSPDETALIFITSDSDISAPEFSTSDEAEMQQQEIANEIVRGVLIAETDTFHVYLETLEMVIDSARIPTDS